MRVWHLEQEAEFQEAEMEAMMAVTKAREEGRFSKRNALKLDMKVN